MNIDLIIINKIIQKELEIKNRKFDNQEYLNDILNAKLKLMEDNKNFEFEYAKPKSMEENKNFEFEYACILLYLTMTYNMDIKQIEKKRLEKKLNLFNKECTLIISKINPKENFNKLTNFTTNEIIKNIFEEYFKIIIKIISKLNYHDTNDINYLYFFLFYYTNILCELKKELNIPFKKKLNDYIEIKNINEFKIVIFESCIKKIIENFLIEIDDYQFVIVNKYIVLINSKVYYTLKSIKKDKRNKKINTINYYTSNSELGMLRLLSKNTENKFEKFIDYATETLIDFRLQKEIFKRSNLIEIDDINNLKILNSFDKTNLEFLKIEKDDNKYIDNRAYIYSLFYFFNEIKCGELFKKNVNPLNTIIYFQIANLKETIQKELINFKSEKEIEKKEIDLDKNKLVIKNIITQINKKLYEEKLNTLINIINEIIGEIKDPDNSFLDSITIFYKMIGFYLNVIIDEIIGETFLFEYSSKLNSILRKIDYIFNIRMYKLTVLIDKNEWYIYYMKYNIQIFDEESVSYNFDNSCTDYKSIVKIIPKELESINESGLDKGFILAGFIQCKPIDYIEQVKNLIPDYDDKKKIGELLFKDKNILNSEYYFIGEYVNEIFKNFEKYNQFQLIESAENLKKKYLKYKKKYLLIKKN
jgi:hypothetical protein